MTQLHTAKPAIDLILTGFPAVILGVCAGMQLLMKSWQRGSANFYGVRVDPGFEDRFEAREIDHAFTRQVILLTVLLMGTALAVAHHFPLLKAPRIYALWMLGLLAALSLGMQALYWLARRKVLPFAAPLDAVRTVDLAGFVQLSPGWLLAYWIAVLLPLSALGAAALYLRAHFGLIPLPENLSGLANPGPQNLSWPAGEIYGVYKPLVTAAFANLESILVAYAFNYRSRISEWGAEVASRGTYRKLLMSRLAILQWLITVQYILRAIRPLAGTAALPISVRKFLLLSTFWSLIWLVGSLVLLYALYKRRPKGAADTGPDRNWRLGKYYCNPQDPALIVPTRFAVGHTLNFGQPLARVIPVFAMLVVASVWIGPSYKPRPLPESGAIVRGPTFRYPDSEQVAYHRALDEIKQPETRERAAAELITYAKSHDAAANHVAHVLASSETHLDDAATLGRESVERIERASARISLDQVTISDLKEMDELAEYWDSLGMVHFAQGDVESAKKYCRIAWEVGGEGLYIGHLAHIALENGDSGTARHLLQVALSGAMDQREQDQTVKRLAHLGVDHPRTINAPTVSTIPRRRAAIGTADFLLQFEAGHPTKVKWIGGNKELADMEPAIASTTFPAQMPDDGPEHVIRIGRLACDSSACKLTLLYSWQAAGEMRSLESARAQLR